MNVSSRKYEPSSEFLKSLVERREPLGDDPPDRQALARLIGMTRHEDAINRDWATFLLRQQGIDTPEVRRALLAAARDNDPNVRAEAILGLAELDPAIALPFVRKALASDSASPPIFEAATIIAHCSLVEDLRAFSEPSGNEYLDALATKALTACIEGNRNPE